MKQQALDHYDRMIAWAEIQPLDTIADALDMRHLIGEDWGPGFCSYCKKYFPVKVKCMNCPLGHFETCCDGLHNKMCMVDYWDKWLIYARQVREYIRING